MPARRSSVDAALSALYAQVPEVGCRGLCQESCGPIEMSLRERRRLAERGVRVPQRPAALAQEGYVCPALDSAGRCGVHAVRPMVCRLWGAMESLACPYGCRVDGGRLRDGDGLDLLAASLQAGGPPAGFEGARPGVGAVLDEDPRLRRVVGDLIRRRP